LQAGIAEMFSQRVQLHRIQAAHLPENLRSAAVLARLGFEREGLARKYLYINGAWRDHAINALLNDTIEAPPAHASIRPTSAAGHRPVTPCTNQSIVAMRRRPSRPCPGAACPVVEQLAGKRLDAAGDDAAPLGLDEARDVLGHARVQRRERDEAVLHAAPHRLRLPAAVEHRLRDRV
jgi:hypothetical protein